MVGMFSLLDLLFACPLWEILKPLSLTDEVRNALLDKQGLLGNCLRLVELSDRTASHHCELSIQTAGLTAETYFDSMVQAYCWVNQVCQDM